MKVGRNAPCPCGSGKKYKRCHGASRAPVTDAPHGGSATAVPDRIDIESPDPEIAALVSEYNIMLGRLPPEKREAAAPMVEALAAIAEYTTRGDEIDEAGEILDAQEDQVRAELSDPRLMMERAYLLFSEDEFANMRFTRADVVRAFDVVGYPPSDAMSDEFADVTNKATMYLSDELRRRLLATRLMLLFPGYVAAGRYADGWLIQVNATLTAERPNELNVFLIAMFQYGLLEWVRSGNDEMSNILTGLGLPVGEPGALSPEEVDARLETLTSDPGKVAEIAKIIEERPGLRDSLDADLVASQSAFIALLDREDAAVLLLSTEEVEPWLYKLYGEISETPKVASAIATGRPMDPALVHEVFEMHWRIAGQMGEDLFTRARRDQLKTQLQEYRYERHSKGDEEEAAIVARALLTVSNDSPAADSFFIRALCMKSMRVGEKALMDHADEGV